MKSNQTLPQVADLNIDCAQTLFITCGSYNLSELIFERLTSFKWIDGPGRFLFHDKILFLPTRDYVTTKCKYKGL